MIVNQCLSYFGHVMIVKGMENKIMLSEMEGSRKRGRQHMRWIEGITEPSQIKLQELSCEKSELFDAADLWSHKESVQTRWFLTNYVYKYLPATLHQSLDISVNHPISSPS